MNTVVPLEKEMLARRAKRIRNLMTDMVKNILAIGAELTEARDTFPIGPRKQRMGWKTWLREEVGLSDTWANSLIRTNRKFGHLVGAPSRIPSVRVLEYLSRENVPEVARSEVVERVGKGEKIGKPQATAIIRKHLPSPKKANELARETGKPTPASDGYVYLGATTDQVKQSTERRTVVYAVREAITRIAEIKLSPQEFLEYAAPHQLWKAREEHQIDDAVNWLKELAQAWPQKRKMIRK